MYDQVDGILDVKKFPNGLIDARYDVRDIN